MSKLDDLKKEYEEISRQLTSQEILSDRQKLQELSKRQSELQGVVDIADKLEKLEKQAQENKELLESKQDEELKNIAQEELKTQQKELERLRAQLNEILHPEPGANIKEVIIEIRPGVGGEESALFAQDLFRMYTRYAEKMGWQINVLEQSQSELKGLKEVTFEVKGDKVYTNLKNESGVHRVQRVPDTEKSGRVHTSTASVAVLPKAKPVDIEIKPEDIKFEAFRSSGPGGQNVNKVSTAVRITHLPTGIAVASQTAKSQSQNRENAMTILRSKLFKIKQEEEERKIREERSQQIGSGERSEKIRTYNFPQDRVTDHRVGKNFSNIYGIMDGGLDKIVSALRERPQN